MPNTIADNLQALNTARLNIADAITNKGGTVNTDKRFSLFPNDINTIPTANLTTLNVTENGTYYESTPTEITSTSFPITLNDSLGTDLLDYLISGNMIQSDTPTPTTPIQPQECGNITANMLSVYKENYSINANGAETYNNVAMIYKANVGVSGSTFTLDFGGLSVGDTVRIHAYTGDTWQEQVNAINIEQVPFSFTVGSNIDNIRISIRKTATDVTMTDGQYKIPISSANATTPVYLGEAETTRRVKKLVLDGTESWEINTTNNMFFYVNHLVDNVRQINGFCTHFSYFVVTSSNTSNGVCVTINGAVRLRYSEYNTVDDFKSFLAAQFAAGTPVTVWYVLATPETAVVNEPLRKIGDYADTLSMEQAGVQIPTNRGNTVIDVMTELKPSQMYIKYDQPSEYAGYNIVNVNVTIPAYINTTIETVNDSLLESLEGN